MAFMGKITGALALGLISLAPALAEEEIAGRYISYGMNADGTRYQGAVEVVQDGPAVSFSWRLSGESYTGAGLMDGRVVAVDWGAPSPVIYVVMPNGELHGTWDNGAALEKLVPAN